jgi:Tetracyclin repressor-like, C-terminal domain
MSHGSGCRAPIVARLSRAQQQGRLKRIVDVNTILDVIFGAIYHRLILGNARLDSAYAADVIEVVFAGIS